MKRHLLAGRLIPSSHRLDCRSAGIIVDDGSLDKTAEIASDYAKRFPWIAVIRNSRREGRNFAAKADAVNSALAEMENLDFDVVGNLDADTSFGPDYMEFLMRKFSEDSRLGVAGTPFTQNGDYDSTRDSFEGENYVAGPCQLFRRNASARSAVTSPTPPAVSTGLQS